MPAADYSDPMEQLNLLKVARQQERFDLKDIMDSHIGAAASTVLAFNQAQLMTRLMDSDPNTLVDTRDPHSPEGGPADPTGPGTGGSS